MPYDGIKKHYYCGKDLYIIDNKKYPLYKILSVDYNEATLSEIYSDREIKHIFNLTSEVPHKMKVGGQSAKRFARIRQNEIVKWFKRLNEYLKNENGNIIIDINDIYYKRFLKYLSTYNKEKIIRQINTGYSGICGIYQSINLLEANKNDILFM